MRSTVFSLVQSVLDGAGEAIGTPSGVSPARLDRYAPKGPNGELDYFGNEVSARHLRGR